jgi:hypothetical protein
VLSCLRASGGHRRSRARERPDETTRRLQNTKTSSAALARTTTGPNARQKAQGKEAERMDALRHAVSGRSQKGADKARFAGPVDDKEPTPSGAAALAP